MNVHQAKCCAVELSCGLLFKCLQACGLHEAADAKDSKDQKTQTPTTTTTTDADKEAWDKIFALVFSVVLCCFVDVLCLQLSSLKPAKGNGERQCALS